MSMKSFIEQKIKRCEALKSARSTTDTYWQDVADYALPSREFQREVSPGSRRNVRIFDITGAWALEQLAGGLHSMLTPPSMDWFTLKIEGYDAGSDEEAGAWLDAVSSRMMNVFNASDAYFSSQVHELYTDVCAFGTGIFYPSAAGNRIFFKSYPLQGSWYAENDRGVVDTLYRETKMSPKAAFQLFGDKVGEKILKKLEQDPYKENCRILHVVEPRLEGVYGGRAKNKPYVSCYIDMDHQHLIHEGGFDTFPYQVPRWMKRSGETYGFGPGMAALPTIKMVNKMGEILIRSAEKLVDPPLMVPHDGVIGPVTLQPAGITYIASGENPIQPLVTNGRPDIGIEIVNGYRQDILRQFYVDYLNLPQRAEMTATEVLQRRDERLRLLSPMVSRLQNEFLGPLIDRVFDLMDKIGMIPAPPQSIAGRPLKVEYLSPIAQAQKFADIESITRSLDLAAFMAQFDPTVIENFDFDAIARYSALKVNNVPYELMKSLEDVKSVRDQRNRQQQQQADALAAAEESKAAKQSAQAVKTLSDTRR